MAENGIKVRKCITRGNRCVHSILIPFYTYNLEKWKFIDFVSSETFLMFEKIYDDSMANMDDEFWSTFFFCISEYVLVISFLKGKQYLNKFNRWSMAYIKQFLTCNPISWNLRLILSIPFTDRVIWLSPSLFLLALIWFMRNISSAYFL